MNPKTEREISAMRESGRMLATVLQYLKQKTSIGMSTKSLSDLAKTELKKLGGKPAFLGYRGFPDVLCVSVNEEVVHGIPKTNKLIKNGDIVSLDFGVVYEGMITDGAISLIVGKASKQDTQLLKTTEQSMYAGINIIKDGTRTGDIGNVIETTLNDKGYGVVRDLVGHGVGHHLHEDPNIPNYGNRHTGSVIHQGMTIAIEPMATLGSYEVIVDNDGWTILTVDGSRAAHFEHTVLVTRDRAEILTTIT